MIEWAKMWTGLDYKGRLEQAKKTVEPFVPRGRIQSGKFYCNICEGTYTGPPYGAHRENDDYTTRYYCKDCSVKMGVSW